LPYLSLRNFVTAGHGVFHRLIVRGGRPKGLIVDSHGSYAWARHGMISNK